MKPRQNVATLVLVALCTLLGASQAFAQIEASSGAYRVRLRTDPPIIPVGQAQLLLEIVDRGNTPVTGAKVRVLVRMPNMNMGERETVAQTGQQPGSYVTQASFMMAGAYEAALAIDGPKGSVQLRVPLHTGQDTSKSPGALRLTRWALFAAVLALLGLTLWRMRRTGQRIQWSWRASRVFFTGMALLVLVTAGVYYAVANWRRPGAMTPIEAQAMEMNTPPPPGFASVTLAAVDQGTVEAYVTYTGQSVAYNEQLIAPRNEGWLVWMPFYPGDTVRRGQVVARLDTTRLDPRVAESRAAFRMAQAGVQTSRSEATGADADWQRVQAETAAKRSALSAAEAELEAAEAAVSSAEAARAAAAQRTVQAQASLDAAKAASEYRKALLQRTRELHRRGAVSTEELQRDVADEASAEASVRDAAARVQEAQAEERAMEAALRREHALRTLAGRKRDQTVAELRAAEGSERAAKAAVEAARSRIRSANAGVDQSLGALQGALIQKGYSEIRALLDGVVTERLAGPGTLLTTGQAILRVAQIQTIRLQANVAAADLTRIRIGSPAEAYPAGRSSHPLRGTITAIVPTVDPVARTGIVEMAVPNRNHQMLPGQNVTLRILVERRDNQLRIPSSAVQTSILPGSSPTSTRVQHYVWLAEPDSHGGDSYRVRRAEVSIASDNGEYAAVQSGLSAGQKVVTSGQRYLKPGDTVRDALEEAKRAASPAVTEATVEVSSAGFRPSTVRLKAGQRCALTFVRKDEQNCGEEVIFPALNIRRKLPLNQPVKVEFTPAAGEIQFTCGMQMLRGKVVAE